MKARRINSTKPHLWKADILTETAYLIEESRNLDASTVAKAGWKEAVDHSTRGCAYPNRPVETAGGPWAFEILTID